MEVCHAKHRGNAAGMNENLFDLVREIGALECVLRSWRDSEVFSNQTNAVLEQYLLRVLHYIEQFAQEIRFLSERMMEQEM